MKCYMLATGSHLSNITWITPNSSNQQGTFFTKKFFERIKLDILSFLENLKIDACYGFEREGYYLYGQKTSSGFYALACNVQLNKRQLTYLCHHLFKCHLEPFLIAADLPKYTQDYQLLQAQAELEEIKEIIRKNIEKVIVKGEKFESLMATVEEFKQRSSQFKHKLKMKEPTSFEPLQNYPVTQAEVKLEETPEILIKKIEEMMIEIEPIDNLLAKTEELDQISFKFKRKGKNNTNYHLQFCNLI
ncbi:hypothetical protein [Legionella gresilensis]|uniref:hypothetical protein n=1 Tax=Legionella gresilensis TaxID=91823 RepID=UPI001040FE5D|nr:hypothetical protein [Legionella gresilensis]